MGALQCMLFSCIFTYLSYYLTPLLPPYLSRFTLLNSRMASAVVTGARLLLATAGAIQKSSGQIEGEDPGEHFPPPFGKLILPPCPSVLFTKAAPSPSS